MARGLIGFTHYAIQGDQPISMYAATFCFLASDIPWDEQTLMKQFRLGLYRDLKDLLLTFVRIEHPLQKLLNEQCSVIIGFLSARLRNNNSK
jgi:hypothetical protein